MTKPSAPLPMPSASPQRPPKAPLKHTEAPSDSLVHHYEKMKELLEEFPRDTTETSYVSSDPSSSPCMHEIYVPLGAKGRATTVARNTNANKNPNVDEDEDEGEDADSGRHSDAMDLRFIGEGLLDLSGVDPVDPVDRLSEISNLSEVDVEGGRTLPRDTVNQHEEGHEKPVQATQRQQTARKEPTSSPSSTLRELPAHNAPHTVHEIPVVKPVPKCSFIHKSCSKFLDVLATEVNDEYLDNVYQDETREELEEDEELAPPAPQRTELLHERHSSVANSKLLSLLSKTNGERTQQGERTSEDSDGDFIGLLEDLSSAARTAGPTRKEVPKLYDTIGRTPIYPRFEIISSDEVKKDVRTEPAHRRSSMNKLQAFLAANGVSNQVTQVAGLVPPEPTPEPENLSPLEPPKRAQTATYTNRSGAANGRSNQEIHDIQTEHQKPTPQRMGTRLTSFFNSYTPMTTKKEEPTETESPTKVPPPTLTPTPAPAPENTVPRKSSPNMIELRQKLDSIKEMCDQSELSQVAIVTISTMLASIHQVVQQDLSCERASHGIQHLRRRLSYTDAPETAITAKESWAKTAKEREIEEKLRLTSPHHSANGEPTPLARVTSQTQLKEHDSKVAPTVGESMRAFEGAQNLVEVLSTFHRLLVDCALGDAQVDDPWAIYSHIKAAVKKKISFRRKQLFKLLDKKLSTDVYRRKPSAGQRVCIIGAGPIGLRAAIEMALLGAQVVVIEKRKHFSRENIVHLWPWVVQDLTSLGAKVLFPNFCRTHAYYHVGTRQLQCILLKVALLFGVTVFPASRYEGIARPNSLAHDRRPFYSVMTEPQIPWMEFTAVLGAAGTQDKYSQDVGLERFVFARHEAIGLVCYFPNRGTMEEKRVSEFMWMAQFKKKMFARMRTLGLDLESIVYYRGEMHYIVMTPKRQNLVDQGVVRTNHLRVKELLADDNINVGKLHEYVTRAICFFKIPQKAPFARVRLFDFSTRTRSDKAASVLSSNGKKLYAGLIGDALLEPFWPEGLGTCCGFLSALDSAWMVSQIGKQSDEQLLADRELGYRIIQHISGVSRGDLQKNVRKYNCDPESRYTVKYPAPLG